MEFLYILLGIAVIILDIFIALEFQRIADKKAAAQTELFEEELHKGDPANA